MNNRKIFLLLTSLYLATQVFSQNVTIQNITLMGDINLKKKLKVRVGAINEGLNNVAVNIDIMENRGIYALYLFDGNYLDSTDIGGFKKGFDVLTWFKKSMRTNVVVDGKFAQKKVNFDGKFINYNENRLLFYPFTRGYWKITSHSISSRFEILNNHTHKGSLYFSFTFLVTEIDRGMNERLLGISQPVTLVIPEDFYDDIPSKMIIWEKKVKEEILIAFLDLGCKSYADIQKSETLSSVYKSYKINQQIEDAIKQIAVDLKDEEYKEKRNELIELLSGFRESQID